MRAPKLDRSRNFGVVFPPEHGATHYQDGWYFCDDGTVCRPLCTPEQLASLGEVVKATPATVPQVKNKGGRPRKHPKPEPEPMYPPSEMDDGTDVNFEGWLRGLQECKDKHVISAVRNRLGGDCTTAKQARDYLVHVEQLVPEAEVKVHA